MVSDDDKYNKKKNARFHNKNFFINVFYLRYYFIFLCLILTIIVSLSISYFLIQEEYKRNTEKTLVGILNSVNKSISIWANEQKSVAKRFSQDPEVIKVASALLKTPVTQESLKDAIPQKKIRAYFQTQLKSGQYRGFFIVGPGNINLASSRNTSLAVSNLLIKQKNLLQKLWRGGVGFSKIQRSDFPLKEHRLKLRYKTMFIGAPIRNSSGKIIALFLLRIDPYKELFKIVHGAHFGKTGETYAFDDNGIMLSPNHLASQLLDKQSLKNEFIKIRVANPGVNLLNQPKPIQFNTNWPLTLMAQSAINFKNAASNLTGYRDFQGIYVVGAWKWNKELDIGLASEQSFKEAYALLHFIRNIFIIAVILSTFFLLVGLIYVIKFIKKSFYIEKELSSIITSANDAIITISDKGIIQTINPAVEKLFGYAKDKLLGENINILMPEPYHSEHDRYLNRYLETGKTAIIGAGREVSAKRADGSIFPVYLSISEFNLFGNIFFSGIIKDITHEKEALKEIKLAREQAEKDRDKYAQANQQLEKTQQAISQAGIGEVWLSINSGEILKVSSRACDMLGYFEDELLGRPIWEFYTAYSKEKYTEIKKILRRKKWHHFDSIAQKNNGSRISVENIATFSNIKATNNCIIIFMLDITKRKEDEVKLILATKATKQASEAKSLFLAAMSHEIRTPLNGIVAAIDILNQTELTYSQKEMVEISLQSAQVLQHIIGDILDFSKIEAGILKLESVSFSLKNELNSVVNSIMPLAKENKVALRSFYDDNIPPIKGDPVRIKQILLNLINNAIKFSTGLPHRTGEVAVSITLKIKKESSVVIEIHVKDNGIGMRESAMNQLFEPFSQGEQSITRTHGGTGLGLTIVKRIVDLMQGSIDITSELNKGSEFTVTLPFPLSDKTVVENQEEETAEKVLLTKQQIEKQNNLILLVDDNKINRKVITHQLEALGYNAETAKNGYEALSMIKENTYDAILTDCHMPGMDGYELTRKIRENEKTTAKHLPIIAITADAMKGTKEACHKSGMDDYIAKPVKLDALNHLLQKWILVKKDNNHKFGGINKQELSNLLGTSDPQVLAEYYQDFLSSSAKTVNALQEAAKNLDIDQVSELAHKLKSSARTIGATELAGYCIALEKIDKENAEKNLIRIMPRFIKCFNEVKVWITKDFPQ